MNKLFIVVLVLLVMNHAIAQSCKTVVPNQIIFPTITEAASLDLSNIFQGQNLSFSSPDFPGTIYNYANPVDIGNTLPSGVNFIQNAIYRNQNDQEWNGQTAFLGTNDTQVLVFPSNFSNGLSPSFDQAIILQQEGTTLNCLGLTYLNSHQVIVDCYDIKDGLLVNEWQIVDTGTNVIQVIPSSNDQNLTSGIIGFGRTIQILRNIAGGNEYILRATLNNQQGPSMLEVFLIEDSLPQVQPVVTLSNLNITNLQLVDFDIAPNGTIFVLNQTNILTAFILDEKDNLLNVSSTVKINPLVSYLSIDIGIDFKYSTNGGYSIFLATTSLGYNVEEWIVIENRVPLQSVFYAVPALLLSTGSPTQMDFNIKHVIVQDRSNVYVFERGIVDLESLVFQQFYQNQVLFTVQGIYADLNKIPEALLVFTSTKVQISLVKVPAFVLQSKTQLSGQITLSATSNYGILKPVTCTAIVNYDFIQVSNVTILQTGGVTGGVNLPTTSYFPDQTTIDISQFISGPLIDVSGKVTSTDIPEEFYDQQQTSLIFDTTYQRILIAVDEYSTSGIVFAQNSFDLQTKTLLQLVQTSDQLSAFLCKQLLCSFAGSIKQTYLISKFAVTYLTNPYLIIPSSKDSLNIYEIVTSSDKRSIDEFHTSISFSYDVTDFTVIGDRLFVVLSEINEIWVYQIANNSPIRLYQITQQNFPSIVGFSPKEIVGSFKTYGPIIFINNKVSALIVSTVGDQIKLVGSIFYIIQQSQATTIKLVGTYLIIVQYIGGSYVQQQINQYNLDDLTTPVIVKSLPLYGGFFKIPLKIESDDNFLYVVMLNNVVNIYKPTSSAHQSLYKQISNPDTLQDNISISGGSDGYRSYVLIIIGNDTLNALLSTQQVLTFIPGSYNNQYQTSNIYTLTMNNSLGTVPLVLSRNISIFNRQQGIEIDTTKYNSSNNNFSVIKKGKSIYNIDPTKYIKGNVASYSIECKICETGKISLINHLMAGSQSIGNLTEVNAMVNYPERNLTFVSNPEGIFTVSSTNQVKKVYTFQALVYSCSVLQLDEARTTLLSVCVLQRGLLSSYITSINLTDYSYRTNYNLESTYIFGVEQAILIGQTAVFIGKSRLYYNPSIIIMDQINGFGALTQYLTCNDNDPTNNGVNDYSLTAIKNILGETTNQTIYALMWTCQQPGQGIQYTTFVFDELTQIKGIIQPQQTLQTNLTFPLPSDTSFLQIQTLKESITSEKTTLSVVVTTNNLMNVILQISFSFNEAIATLTSTRLVTTLTPYGKWSALNSLSYTSGLLAIPYTKNLKQFLAVYNLNGLDYEKTINAEIPMVGGFYQNINSNYEQKWVFIIQDALGTFTKFQTQILTINPNFIASLQSFDFHPLISIVVDATESFDKQIVLFTAQNDYTSQQFIMNIDYNVNIDEESEIEWWGWTLIVIAVLLVVGGITVGILKFMRKDKVQGLLVN